MALSLYLSNQCNLDNREIKKLVKIYFSPRIHSTKGETSMEILSCWIPIEYLLIISLTAAWL